GTSAALAPGARLPRARAAAGAFRETPGWPGPGEEPEASEAERPKGGRTDPSIPFVPSVPLVASESLLLGDYFNLSGRPWPWSWQAGPARRGALDRLRGFPDNLPPAE